MNTTTRFTPLFALALFVITSQGTHAASMQLNSIAPFDTNLGTLTHVTVFLNPNPVQTNSENSNFSNSHQHSASSPPVTVPGLGGFNFPAVLTSASSGNPLTSHDHIVDLSPAVKNFGGASLSWFLNPGNAPINSVSMPFFHTSTSAGHDHTVHPFPVTPLTIYTFDPVPEPTTLGLLSLGLLMMTVRRQRP